MGAQRWRTGESARLPPMWPRFKSWLRRHMWIDFVVVSLLCSERFFSTYSGFPLSSKTNISKFDQELGRRRTTLWKCYLQIIIIIIIIIKFCHVVRLQFSTWVACCGFTLGFGGMFLKTWRVHKIFLNRTRKMVG